MIDGLSFEILSVCWAMAGAGALTIAWRWGWRIADRMPRVVRLELAAMAALLPLFLTLGHVLGLPVALRDAPPAPVLFTDPAGTERQARFEISPFMGQVPQEMRPGPGLSCQDQGKAKVGSIGQGAARDGAPVAVRIEGLTGDGPSLDDVHQGGFGRPAGGGVHFRRVDARKPDAQRPKSKRVAIDHAGRSLSVDAVERQARAIGRAGGGQDQEQQRGEHKAHARIMQERRG